MHYLDASETTWMANLGLVAAEVSIYEIRFSICLVDEELIRK